MVSLFFDSRLGIYFFEIDLNITFIKVILLIYTYISFLCFVPTLLFILHLGNDKSRYLLYIIWPRFSLCKYIYVDLFNKKDLV